MTATATTTSRLVLTRTATGDYVVNFDGNATQYEIRRDEWLLDSMDCDHWNCARVHGRFRKADESGRIYCTAQFRKRVEWYIIDTATGERDRDLPYPYTTRKAAVADLDRRLTMRAEFAKPVAK